MKTKFFLAIATVMTLFFTSCKKTEIFTEEMISTEKSLTNVLEGSSWEVLSVVSVPKNVNISFTVKHPKMNFYNDYIEMKLGRDLCSKHYLLSGDRITVDFVNCTISNPNHQSLSDLLEGEFQYILSDNGEEMTIKNNSETEITLRKVAQLSTSTPVASTVSINATVQ